MAALTEDGRATAALSSATLALDAGAVFGIYLASHSSPSISRVRYVDLGGVLGGLAAGSLYIAIDQRAAYPQAGFAAATVGTVAGLAIALAATSGMPSEKPRSGPSNVAGFLPTILPARGGAELGVAGSL
jgi:hypothetical protein